MKTSCTTVSFRFVCCHCFHCSIWFGDEDNDILNIAMTKLPFFPSIFHVINRGLVNIAYIEKLMPELLDLDRKVDQFSLKLKSLWMRNLLCSWTMRGRASGRRTIVTIFCSIQHCKRSVAHGLHSNRLSTVFLCWLVTDCLLYKYCPHPIVLRSIVLSPVAYLEDLSWIG